jgi:glycosyltransferase involved in cell wall biosynthesis
MKKQQKDRLTIEPWHLSTEARLKIFDEAKADGKRIALYFVKEPESTTFRYRCFNTFQATQKSKRWQAVYFFWSEKDTVLNLIKNSDLIILGRQSRWNNIVQSVIESSKKCRIPVLFDLDDLVFDRKYFMTVINTIGEFSNIDYWVPYFDDMNNTAKNVDGFIVTNDYLGNKTKECFGKEYKVIRNSLNDEQLLASDAYLSIKKKDKKSFLIGYFSGSSTHINDFETALPEIFAFLRAHKDAKLKIVGFIQFDSRAKDLLEGGQIIYSPPVDFRRLQREMSEVDVNIAPLVINDFTNCKSELKFFEAAAVETTTIASPSYTFERAIKNGKNGILAGPGEWYNALESLYKNRELNKKIAKKARQYVIGEYSGKRFLDEIESSYDYFARG